MALEIQDIITSVSVPSLILDEFIRPGTFIKLRNGDVQSYVGGFSIVFPVQVNNETWAFRCWHTQIEDAYERYKLIGSYLSEKRLPYFCDFSYSLEGIVVNGKKFPTTKMKWVEGETIKEYICKFSSDSSRLLVLADRFLEMCQVLHKNHIAHGDLQHGNILVSPDGSLKLVDYDSLYVPTMGEQYRDVITGLADYQHPARKTNAIASEGLDYFSEVVIYTSLLGVAKDSSLASEYNIEDSERLLFSASDFEDFTNSAIYQRLTLLKDDRIDLCLSIINEYLKEKDIDRLKPIETYLVEIEIIAPDRIPTDQACTLAWKVSGAKSLTIHQFGEVEFAGLRTVSPQETTDYVFLIETDSGQVIERRKTICVCPYGVIKSFKPEREFTFRSVPIRISWECQDMETVVLVGHGPQPSVGEISVELPSDTVFTLVAKDHFKEYRERFTVRVLPYPSIQGIRVPVFNRSIRTDMVIRVPKLDAKAFSPNISIVTPKLYLDASIQPSIGDISIISPEISLAETRVTFTSRLFQAMKSFTDSLSDSTNKLVEQIKTQIHERDN